MNKTQWLNKTLGGNWVYCGRGGMCRSWKCNDGRIVRYTAAPVDQFDNPYGPPQCWIDDSDGKTKPFHFTNVRELILTTRPA